MAGAISMQDLEDAKVDVGTISTAANSPDPTLVNRLGRTQQTLSGAIGSIAAITDRGAWATGAAYMIKDIVTVAGIVYICVSAHTAGATFAGDSAKWRVHQGATVEDLANSTDPAKGAGLVGYKGRSQAGKNREFVSVIDGLSPLIDPATTDCTAHVQSVINANAFVTFPAGYTVRLDGYVGVPSNHTIKIAGKIKLKGRSAGFDVLNASNVEIYGTRGSEIWDDDVLSDYRFNDILSGHFSPVVHIRQNGSGVNQENIVVRGLRFHHTSMGVFVSNLAQSHYTSGGMSTIGADYSNACFNVDIYGNFGKFIEGSGFSANFAYKVTIAHNRLYRAGDAGIYFISVGHGKIIHNRRESPYGDRSASTTLNDGQGISVERSSDIEVSNNYVVAFQGHGIDIKNQCTRVTVCENTIIDCQFSSINSRFGDPGSGSGTGDVVSIDIINNTVKNHGYIHTSSYGTNAAIVSDSFFMARIKDNKVYGLLSGSAIKVTGPGNELIVNHSGNPRISSAEISGNTISWLKGTFDFSPQYDLGTVVGDVILCSGGYLNKLLVKDNNILGDRISNDDVRANPSYCIRVNVDGSSTIGGNKLFPSEIEVIGNSAIGWIGSGMLINGAGKTYKSAVSIRGNKCTFVRGTGIYVYGINGLTFTDNTVMRANAAAMVIDSCANFIVSSNKGLLPDANYASGATTQTHGLSIQGCDTGIVTLNVSQGSAGAGVISASGNTNITINSNI